MAETFGEWVLEMLTNFLVLLPGLLTLYQHVQNVHQRAKQKIQEALENLRFERDWYRRDLELARKRLRKVVRERKMRRRIMRELGRKRREEKERVEEGMKRMRAALVDRRLKGEAMLDALETKHQTIANLANDVVRLRETLEKTQAELDKANDNLAMYKDQREDLLREIQARSRDGIRAEAHYTQRLAGRKAAAEAYVMELEMKHAEEMREEREKRKGLREGTDGLELVKARAHIAELEERLLMANLKLEEVGMKGKEKVDEMRGKMEGMEKEKEENDKKIRWLEERAVYLEMMLDDEWNEKEKKRGDGGGQGRKGETGMEEDEERGEEGGGSGEDGDECEGEGGQDEKGEGQEEDMGKGDEDGEEVWNRGEYEEDQDEWDIMN